MIITRQMVVAEARTWDQVRYKHQGRDRFGVDCVGLVLCTTNALGLTDYHYSNYTRVPDGSEFLKHFELGGWTRIRIEDALPGDLLACKGGAYACHVALITEVGPMAAVIHAHASHHKVVEELLLHELKASIVAAFKTPGLD